MRLQFSLSKEEDYNTRSERQKNSLKMSVSLATQSSQLVCLVAILGAFGLTAANQEIPSGYHQIPELGVSYKVYNQNKIWTEARRTCMAEGAILALVDTMEKVKKIAPLKKFNQYVWIGISRIGTGASWRSTNNTILIDLPWAPTKPEGPHNCLAVRGCNKGLTNEECSRQLGFVCEI